MFLRQTLREPVQSWAMDYPSQTFDWRIEGTPQRDEKGAYVRVGCWRANHWFHVAVGKTERQTLANARRRLTRTTHAEIVSFEYIKEEHDSNV